MRIIKSLVSNNKKVQKFLQQTKDRNIIETGFYDLEERVICLSTQIGCTGGCIFCASSAKTFLRNLTSGEIVEQAENVLKSLPSKLKTKGILFSYMGMGEPLLNYQNVVQSMKVLTKGYPGSRVTIATIGSEPERIKSLINEKIPTKIKLHFSLHAPNDDLRKKIIPRSAKILPTLKLLKHFSEIKKVIPKINYLLIKNLNDGNEHARQLAGLLKSYPFIVKLCRLNLYNNLEPSAENRFALFENILNSHGIKTCRFSSEGTDIEAGCGQFKRWFLKDVKKGKLMDIKG